MSDDLHKGHRERLRQEFAATGLSGKSQHQALELLLTYAIPRIDVNPIAHMLITKFGSISSVMDANINELIKEPNISMNVAVLLKLIPELIEMYCDTKNPVKASFATESAIIKYLYPRFIHEVNEVFYVLSLDSHLSLIAADRFAEGTPNSASLDLRGITSAVLRRNASTVILAHNHISGYLTPSENDINSTILMIKHFEQLGISVAEHFIFAGDKVLAITTSKEFKEKIDKSKAKE